MSIFFQIIASFKTRQGQEFTIFVAAVSYHKQSWPKTMWTVAFDQLFKQKCKFYRSLFNAPAPLNNVVLQYVV